MFSNVHTIHKIGVSLDDKPGKYNHFRILLRLEVYVWWGTWPEEYNRFFILLTQDATMISYRFVKTVVSLTLVMGSKRVIHQLKGIFIIYFTV